MFKFIILGLGNTYVWLHLVRPPSVTDAQNQLFVTMRTYKLINNVNYYHRANDSFENYFLFHVA